MSLFSLLHVVPKNLLSLIVGNLVHLKLPNPLRLFSLRWFIKRYQIDMNEASRPIHEYSSIGDLFVRDLKAGIRPIGDGVVSPIDGTLRGVGVVSSDRIDQVKGKQYTVTSLLQNTERAKEFEGGTYLNLYLSPQDYHHVHSPISGSIIGIDHIPGALWPVNDWSIRNIENLFGINERTVIYIKNDSGIAAIAMVAALNVGGITLTCGNYESGFKGRLKSSQTYPLGTIVVSKGSRLGTFRMGSSVVALFSKGMFEPIESMGEFIERKIHVGVTLGR